MDSKNKEKDFYFPVKNGKIKSKNGKMYFVSS